MPRLTICLLLLAPSCVVVADGRTTAPEGAPRRDFNDRGPGDTRPFSDAVLVGDTLYVAGTLGLDPETREVPQEVEDEVRFLLDGFRAKLVNAGLSMDDLVMVQVFCSDVELYGTFNAIYRTYFESGFPSRAFVGSGPLLFGAHFEINGIAARR